MTLRQATAPPSAREPVRPAYLRPSIPLPLHPPALPPLVSAIIATSRGNILYTRSYPLKSDLAGLQLHYSTTHYPTNGVRPCGVPANAIQPCNNVAATAATCLTSFLFIVSPRSVPAIPDFYAAMAKEITSAQCRRGASQARTRGSETRARRRSRTRRPGGTPPPSPAARLRS